MINTLYEREHIELWFSVYSVTLGEDPCMLTSKEYFTAIEKLLMPISFRCVEYFFVVNGSFEKEIEIDNSREHLF